MLDLERLPIDHDYNYTIIIASVAINDIISNNFNLNNNDNINIICSINEPDDNNHIFDHHQFNANLRQHIHKLFIDCSIIIVGIDCD